MVNNFALVEACFTAVTVYLLILHSNLKMDGRSGNTVDMFDLCTQVMDLNGNLTSYASMQVNILHAHVHPSGKIKTNHSNV